MCPFRILCKTEQDEQVKTSDKTDYGIAKT